jgi:hypothetical protein
LVDFATEGRDRDGRHLRQGNPSVTPPVHSNSTGVELLTRSVSVAVPFVMKLMATAGKPSPIKAQGNVGLPVNVPPLKREEGAGRPPWPIGLPVSEGLLLRSGRP